MRWRNREHARSTPMAHTCDVGRWLQSDLGPTDCIRLSRVSDFVDSTSLTPTADGMTGGRPQRRVTDHVHPDSWQKEDQHRFEDGLREELKEIRNDLERLANRVLMIFGGIAVLAFIIPLLIPILRDWLNIPQAVVP